MKEKLATSKIPEHIRNFEIANELEKTFLFDGYLEYFCNLVPKAEYSSIDLNSGKAPSSLPESNPFPNVLCHNDIHQNNILMSLKDNT